MNASLVVDLVEAMSRSHTEATCAAAALDVLRRHWGATRLEIDIDKAGRAANRIGAGQVARSSSRRRTVVAPLADVCGASGRATLILPSGNGHFVDEADVEVFGRVLASALRHVHAIQRVADVSRLAHARVKALGEHLKELALPSSIVATAPATRKIFFETIPLVARRDTSVLVLGETGTGKELVATRIHELSQRSRRPFVRVNCGAIPSELVESTLFGHEPGAFTGAVRRQIGVFERAHRGTLFLDEIGELSLGAQVKLLRVLESGELERVGAERTTQVDVRLVAATHRQLERLVAQGVFREDLFYRLNVFPIVLPPLRERRTEIPALSRQILADLAHRFGEVAPKLDKRMLALLTAHSWPGNVRELRNVLERGLLLRRGDTIELDLPSPRDAAVGSFEHASRSSIEAALRQSGGRIYGGGGAAELLGLKPTTLASKMKRLGVPGPRPSTRTPRQSRQTPAARSDRTAR